MTKWAVLLMANRKLKDQVGESKRSCCQRSLKPGRGSSLHAVGGRIVASIVR